METLHTIASISRHLSIPESTLRYRAKMFKDFLPVKGVGRKKRFLESSIERFSYMDEMFNKGLIADDIRVKLADKYDSQVEAEVAEPKTVKKTKKTTTSNSKEIAAPEMMFEVQEFIMPMVKVIENQEVIISELRKQNKMLEVSTTKKKGFFARLFGG